MRRLILLAALAAAVVTSALAAPGPQLAVDHPRYELARPGAEVEVGFTVTPAPDGIGPVHILTCHNQHFDRSKLTAGNPCLEQNGNGGQAENGRGTVPLSEPGRYEAYATQWLEDSTRVASSIVPFEIVDTCRLTIDVVPRRTPGTMLAGAPAPCSGSGLGRATLHGEDGTLVRISAQGLLLWSYDTRSLRVPLFAVNGQGKQVAIDFRGGSRLGRIVDQVSVPAVVLFTTGPTDLSVVHRNGTATVRVRRGTAVGFRLTQFGARAHVLRRCPARPTVVCLARIHYTVGGLRKREEYGKVIRAGRTATFRYRGWR